MNTKVISNKKSENSLYYQRKNGWSVVNDKEKKEIDLFAKEYMSFLSNSKTEREFHDNAVNFLKDKGFKDISEFKSLKTGDRVYLSSYGKTLFAFIIGEKDLSLGMHIVGSHIDSPRIDIKQNPLYENSELAYFDTHYYG